MFFGKSEHKLLGWRSYRNTLTDWPQHIKNVAEKWAQAPIVNNYLSYDNTKAWPDAWTLINDGIFCDISVALGMFYTLYYTDYKQKDTMKIHCYDLRTKHQMLNLLLLEDGLYTLNYNVGEVVNINSIGDLPDPVQIVTANDLPV